MIGVLKLYFENIIIQKFILAVLCFMAIDLVLGLSKAINNNNFSSYKLRSGIIKIIEYISVIVIGVIADFLFSVNVWCVIACSSLCVIELTSISENYEESQIKAFLSKIKDTIKGDDDEI